VKYDLDKNKKYLLNNANRKFNPNLINEYFLSEYIDLSEDIEYYLHEVDFLSYKNLTKNLNKREINLISRFYNITKNNPKRLNYQTQNTVFYYNNITFLMLSMLSGGIIGVMIILYISIKTDNTFDNFYNNKNMR